MNIKFTYTAIQVRDMEKSVKFYSKILGMKIKGRHKIKQTDGEMCVLKSGTNTLELNKYFKLPYKKGTNLDHLAFKVKEFDKFLEELKRKHIKTHDYLETKNWKRFWISDPDGNWIEIFHMNEK